MADISAAAVKELRERTGAGLHGLQARARGDRRRPRQGRRAAPRAGPRGRRQEGRPRRPRGAGLELHPHRRPRSACSSRSTARRTSSPGPTSSRSSSATSPSRWPGSRRCTSTRIASRPTPRAEAAGAARGRGGPEEARGASGRRSSRASSRSGSRRSACSSSRSATGADGPRADHRGDRHDRREHPRPAVRPLRARGGAVSDDPAARPRRRRPTARRPGTGAPLPADPAQAVRRGPPGRSRQYGVDPAFCAFIARQVARGPRSSASRSGSSSAAATSSAASRPPPRGHGPRDRRLHRHARHGHERPGPPGRPRAGRRADPGHDARSR